MTDKQKIIAIYTGVAVISLAILGVTAFIRSNKVKPRSEDYFTQPSQLTAKITLNKDLTLTRQDGKEVKLSDLKGKVWAFAQFYASCPMCAKRNSQGLKQLYERFKNEPDFLLICITVNPESDGVAEMKSYAEALGANTNNWWFLTGDPKDLLDYMRNEMKYDSITKRTDPEEIALKGELAHDMSIAVFNREMSLIDRRNLTDARKQGDAVYRETEKALHQLVEAVLRQP